MLPPRRRGEKSQSARTNGTWDWQALSPAGGYAPAGVVPQHRLQQRRDEVLRHEARVLGQVHEGGHLKQKKQLVGAQVKVGRKLPWDMVVE